jgi:hypothetical protein
MSNRFAELAEMLARRHEQASPAAASPAPASPALPSPTDASTARPSRLWLSVLVLGTAVVAAYYTPSFDSGSRAVAYVAIEALAVAVVFVSLRFGRPARPLAWALFGAGMLSVLLGDVVWLWLANPSSTRSSSPRLHSWSCSSS